ncbi:MAG: hypothetical protein KDB24_11890 [Microthrixaceae bacterium]|nr:hypothetical protein [Microthrixaceae bacterium]
MEAPSARRESGLTHAAEAPAPDVDRFDPFDRSDHRRRALSMVEQGSAGSPAPDAVLSPGLSRSLDELTRLVATGTTDARVHLDRVSRAVGDARADEVWGALIDLFLLFDTNSAGIRGRALFWGRPLLTDGQHQFLADHLGRGLGYSSPVLPKPKRSVHWRGVVGRQVVSSAVVDEPEPEFDQPTDVSAALGRLLERSPAPNAPAPATEGDPHHRTAPDTAPPPSAPDAASPDAASPDAAAQGARMAQPAHPARPVQSARGGRRAPTADSRVRAALLGRATADTPLKGDDTPQQHAEPTLADSVGTILDMVADDREPRALVGPGGTLQLHPDRTADVGLSEIRLSAWCEPPPTSDLSIRPVDGRARGHRILTWDQLRWELGSRCAAGWFPCGLDLGSALVLREVPDLGALRRLPGDHTVLTVLRSRPATIAEIRSEGVELRHLAALVGAMAALGVLTQDPSLHLVTDQGEGIADIQLTWFERLRLGLSEW